jgi:hypothetical protein
VDQNFLGFLGMKLPEKDTAPVNIQYVSACTKFGKIMQIERMSIMLDRDTHDSRLSHYIMYITLYIAHLMAM